MDPLPTRLLPFPHRRAGVLLGLLGAATLLLASVPAAWGVPPTPALTGTNPVSPGTSATPFVLGRADGIIPTRPKSGFPRRINRGSGGPDPNETISIYTNPSCSGTPVATGTAAQLESTGIQVPVAPDSITTFFANATDSVPSTSACSAPGLVYQQVTTGPAPPVLGTVSPISPANDNTPTVDGTAALGSTVFIHTNPNCTGTAVGTGTAAQFASSGIQATVADDTTTTLYARAVLAGINSLCSAAGISYREDSTPPKAPDLHMVPGPRANNANPSVAGSAPGAATVKLYDKPSCGGAPLATGTPAELTAGFPVTVGENSTTSFFAVAIDAAGNKSGCSGAPVTYTEDSIAPHTRITLGPAAKTRRRSTSFRFTDASGDAGTSFLCKLDRGSWRPCGTPRRLRRLRYGVHTFRVKAIDAAGNQEQKGAKRRFKVVRRR